MKKGDIADVVENANNINISKYLAVVPFPYTKKKALSWFNHSLEKQKKNPKTDYTFVIEDKSLKKVIGAIGLHDLNYIIKKAELGYWLGEDYQGKGVMSEAVNAVLGFAFSKLKLNRIEAHVFTENIPSAKLLYKFGFQKEGTFRQSGYSKAAKKIYDEDFYALLHSEYKNFKIKNN